MFGRAVGWQSVKRAVKGVAVAVANRNANGSMCGGGMWSAQRQLSISSAVHQGQPANRTAEAAAAVAAPTVSSSRRSFPDEGNPAVLPFSAFLTDTFGRQHSYCMPEEGIELTPDEELLSDDEIIRLAELFVSEGVNKIRLTGGEPLVHRSIEELIGRLNAIDGLNTIAITTNALVLHRKLPKLVEAGLTHVNISLDTLMDFKFEIISRRKGFKQVMKGIDTALELGLPVKLNCVAMKGFNDDEIVDFVAMTKDKDIDIRFIEYMPFGGNKWSEGRFLSYADMVALIQEKYPDFAPIDALKAEVTAKAWKVPGHAGQIGFITSMSDHFCGDCNRLRMTHDGNLKVCLFGNTEVNMAEVLRSGVPDSEVLEIIGAAVGRKKKQHAGMHNLTKMKNRPMILIGG